MARNNDLDAAALLRLKEEIARGRLQLAQRVQLEETRPQPPNDPRTQAGRLYRVFRLMREC